ncbi:MAG: hypothetical protein LBE91_21700 [Tannerella sp.]|jgi:glycosyltransferase involved in cell wall biosynthesis|nr:hypothetical protein [Tannerella sp.]
MVKNDKHNILIISGTCFPAQFPRALRCTELAIEFAKQGHNVTVYAKLGTFDYSDFEVKYNVKIKNIERFLPDRENSDGIKTLTFFQRILNRLLRFLINYPDIEMMFRIPGIIKKEKDVECLITIAVPHSNHWGAALAKWRNKTNFPKKWIADCGDPCMGNPNYTPPFYFKYLEKWFCKEVNYITVPIEEAKKAYYSEFSHKIKVIPQGFNFDSLNKYSGIISNEIVTFAYAGALYPRVRNPRPFLEYLVTVRKPFKFILYTSNKSLIEPYIEQLGNNIECRDYIERAVLIYELSKMDFLVNFENISAIQSPSKLIDYAYTERPILSVGNVIQKNIIDEFLEKNYINRMNISIDNYRIENIANDFLKLIN